MDKHHPIVKLLQQTTIDSLLHEERKIQLISISQDEHLVKALSFMAQAGILSLPVKLEEKSLDFVGFLDVLDIVFFVIKTCTEGENLEEAQWR